MQEALPSLPSLGFACSCHFPSPSSPPSSTSSPRPPFTPKASLLSQHSEASAQSWAGRCPFLGPLPQSSSLAPPPDSPPGSPVGRCGGTQQGPGCGSRTLMVTSVCSLPVFLYCFPAISLLGLFPQIDTFCVYLLEQINMLFFGGSGKSCFLLFSSCKGLKLQMRAE